MFDRLKSILDGIQKPKGTQTLGLNLNVGRGAPVRVQGIPNPVPASKKRLSVSAPDSGGVSFAVDDVVPASGALWQGTLSECVEIRADATILIIPDGDMPALAPEGYAAALVPGETRQPYRTAMKGVSLKGPVSVARQLAHRQKFQHPLIEAVHLAFSEHRPLILSPDSIWLTIAQGFGQHVHENAEALRDRMVSHRKKQELLITTDSLDPSRWPSLISQFSAQIRQCSDPVLHETLVCEFSTTTPNVKTAYEVALMDTYQCYFDYGMRCVCGIPKITVQGKAEDWRRIRERIEVLTTYGLEWWGSRLRPILEQFEAAAEGSPDIAFWQAIYKPQKAYAAELASGWIADLFPYLFGAPRDSRSTGPRGLGLRLDAAAYRNHVLNMPRVDWVLPPPAGPMAGNGVNLKNFPSGLSRVPVKLHFPDRSDEQVELVAGFLGITQLAGDNALAPLMSWAVVQRN